MPNPRPVTKDTVTSTHRHSPGPDSTAQRKDNHANRCKVDDWKSLKERNMVFL